MTTTTINNVIFPTLATKTTDDFILTELYKGQVTSAELPV